MTEKQILGFKPAPRLEQVDNEHSERMEDRKHRLNDAMILPHDANLGRMEFSERTAREAPRYSMIHFEGDDPEDGPIVRYTMATRTLRQAA